MLNEIGKGTDNISINTEIGLMEVIRWKPKWAIKKYDRNMDLYGTEIIEGNLLLNEGITSLLTLLIGGTETAFDNTHAYIGVGDGTTAAAATQTGLVGTNKTYAPMDSNYPIISGQTVTFRATFGPNAGNHAWREFTIANGNSDTAKNLNRKVESALRTKVNPDTWVIQLSITLS